METKRRGIPALYIDRLARFLIGQNLDDARVRLIMVDWSSMPPDLIRRVGDCFLADSDVDRYMDMRAVCRGWRYATDDPCRCDAAAGDASFLRFCPRKWVMIEEEPNGGGGDDDTRRLFLNVSTGRFLRLRVPALRDHVLVAASDGLLVLAAKERPHAARLLNPLTGSLLRFAAPIPSGIVAMRAAVAAGSDDGGPSLLFSFQPGQYYCDAASCPAPATRRLMPVQLIHPAAAPGQVPLPSMATHAGHVYMATRDGSAVVKKIVGPAQSQQHYYAELVFTAQTPPFNKARHGQTFLVASAGELLLARRLRRGHAEVLRVDVERKVVTPVRDIGRRALFLGERCLSVDADKLPSSSVGTNCVYYIGMNGNGIFECDLQAGKEERICSSRVRPFSLVQALLNYCTVLPDAKAQLHRIYRTTSSHG